MHNNVFMMFAVTLLCGFVAVKAQFDYRPGNFGNWPRITLNTPQDLPDTDGACRMRNGEDGFCTPLQNCPAAMEAVLNKDWPLVCKFQGRSPIVCCQMTSNNKIVSPGFISKQKCGQYYRKKISSRFWFGAAAAHGLIGGVRVSPREFPHMAALGYGDQEDPIFACGGSLISEKFVLTAAHCLSSKHLGDVVVVRLGDLNLRETNDEAKPENFGVSRRIKHPGYKQPSQYNDIGLIELDSTVNYNDFIKPACLQTLKNIQSSAWMATGWGSTQFGGKSADHLQKVELQPYDKGVCQETYPSNRRLINGIDEDTQICAWEDEKDTCQGDSGGPLQVRNKDYIGGYTIIGITSFGKACGVSNSPGVYTRVSNYVGWIESVVWSSESKDA